MLEKLEAIYQRWKDVEAELSSPDVMADMKRYAQLNKEYKDLAKVVDEYNIYRNIMSNIDSNKEILATEKDEEFREMLEVLGETPLPKYIKRKPDEEDKERYQTVYAGPPGSVAAPTAGLHFTGAMLERIVKRSLNRTLWMFK